MTDSSDHLHWSADALWQQLEPYLPGISVEVVARAESTNTVLLERARPGAGRRDAPITTPGELDAQRERGLLRDEREGGSPHGRRAGDTQPCLLVAELQTLGRGRQGRTWQSATGASLTFSLGLPLAPRDWSGLSLAVGVALADALDPPDPARARRIGLKWPNDLWLQDAPGRGRKLGGILIETVAVGPRRMAVIGVGLNIAPLTEAGPAVPPREFAHGYACLQEIDRAATAPSALHRVALPLVRAVLQFEREGFVGFASAYAQRDLLRGREIDVIDPLRGEPLASGRYLGLAPNGALLVGSNDGRTQTVGSGEVSVRLAAPAP